MSSKPIQLTNNAFLMLRKAIENVDAGIGIGLSAADIVPAAELIDAEYASVRDVDDKVELHATPVGVKYMKTPCWHSRTRGWSSRARFPKSTDGTLAKRMCPTNAEASGCKRKIERICAYGTKPMTRKLCNRSLHNLPGPEC